MRLICETCHRRWKLAPGEKRWGGSCPACRRARSLRREAAGLSRRRIALEARGEPLPSGPPPTPDQLLALMSEADSKAARALELATSLATRFRSPDRLK